jgi:hypothetical protein
MQTLIRTFLALCFGHLLTDFVFQTPALVARKRNGKPTAYFFYGLVHYLSASALTAYFIPGSILSLRAQAVVAGLTLIHLLIDFSKIQLGKHEIAIDGSVAFITDQMLHLVAVAFAACLMSTSLPSREISALWSASRNVPSKFLAVPVIYIAVMFGGGYLIRSLTRSFSEGVKGHSSENTGQQLQNAGLYIGWLERFLVLTALLLQSPATIGLILTAKSIARYPEFKSERFAEYFLIGTLLSLSIALVGGAFLAKLLLGQIRFSG